MKIINLLKKEITQQDLLNYYNANITYIDLPDNIHGFIYSYKNIYNIFINKELSYYRKKKTILHELAHIELDQLGQINKELFAFKVNQYEDEADKYIKDLESIYERKNDTFF